MFVWQEALQQPSTGGELFVEFCSFYHGHVVVPVVLGDEAHRLPLVYVVVRVVRDKLLCVGLVQSVNLDGAVQGPKSAVKYTKNHLISVFSIGYIVRLPNQ
uniref:Uncharacterized protein n=1 Tax=Gouania willdenowi TaxID=441366 RepID=A0A8C5H459_GOUWI